MSTRFTVAGAVCVVFAILAGFTYNTNTLGLAGIILIAAGGIVRAIQEVNDEQSK